MSDFRPDLGSDSGLDLSPRSGSLWGPIWGPSGGGHFRLRSFSSPPHKRICFIRRSQIFHVLKMGVLGGGAIWRPKGPPSAIKFGLRFGVQLGSPIGLQSGPFGGPFWAAKMGSLFGTRNASQTLCIQCFRRFSDPQKGAQIGPPGGTPFGLEGGPENLRKGGPEFPKTL